jgi:hypothetical protein
MISSKSVWSNSEPTMSVISAKSKVSTFFASTRIIEGNSSTVTSSLPRRRSATM